MFFRKVHVVRRSDGIYGDTFEVAEVPVPAELWRPSNIEQRRAALRQRQLLFADRARLPVGPRQARIVTSGARSGFGARQNRIKEQSAPERVLGLRVGVVFRIG